MTAPHTDPSAQTDTGDAGVRVRTYPAAEGSDDASTTYAIDVLGWTFTIRRRHLFNEPPLLQQDTVIEISEGDGPVEVILRGLSSYYE